MLTDRKCDVLIRGGIVYDGTGAPGGCADIAITNDRIVAIGELDDWHAGQVVHAEGLCVAPAFIDLHTHSDFSSLHNPDQMSVLYQGIGTQIVGNCGIGVGQMHASPVFAMENRWLAPHGVTVDWTNLREHLNRIEDNGIGTNYIALCAHGTLRKSVMGFDKRKPTAGELETMKQEVTDTMEMGAWGFTTGLEYTPGSYAETEEIIELAKVAARYGGFYATHLRNEGDFLVENVQEALQIAEEAGMPLQLSHHKSEGKKNWGKVHTTLQMVSEAVQKGQDVMLDVYPYTAYQTSMAVAFLPDWALAGSPKEIIERFMDPDGRAKIIEEMQAKEHDWALASIGSVPKHRHLQGQSVADAAKEAGLSPEELVLELLNDEGGFVSVANFVVNEEDLKTVLQYPLTMVGSDGIGYRPEGKMKEERPHPRSYGAFPRVLGRYTREQEVLGLEEAIFKMTGMPAARLGIADRGLLRPEAYADVVIFDFGRIGDRATFENPHQLAEGVVHLMINGRWALKDGTLTGNRAGRVLRKNEESSTPNPV
jgi:N-acyl-D-amino-acid deacylase